MARRFSELSHHQRELKQVEIDVLVRSPMSRVSTIGLENIADGLCLESHLLNLKVLKTRLSGKTLYF